MTLISPSPGIIHPVVLESLARAGHMAQILVTDAFYSTATATNPLAPVVHVALTAGSPTVTDVVAVLGAAIPVEELTRMRPEEPADTHPVFAEVEAVLPTGVGQAWLGRQEFYAQARSQDVALCLATGDTRRFANVLLRIGGPGTAR